MGIFIYILIGYSIVFANEPENEKIKTLTPIKLKRNAGMNQ